jgi:hypothetical protein
MPVWPTYLGIVGPPASATLGNRQSLDRDGHLLVGIVLAYQPVKRSRAGRTVLVRGLSPMRLRPKWTVRLWLTSVGMATVAWLAGLTWAAIWLVELALS